MTDDNVFVECQDLIKIYADEKNRVRVPALRGLEMKVLKREISLVVGPSGSGKSTLLNILAGNLKPSAGVVIVGDTDIAKFTRAQMVDYRRRRVGVVWQLPQMNLVWELSASQNIQVPMRILGLPREERMKRTKELLEEVELWPELWSLDWVIVGGESGPGARICKTKWIREVVRRCADYNTPCFVKQLGGHPDKRDNPEQWPEDLRVRQWPEVER